MRAIIFGCILLFLAASADAQCLGDANNDGTVSIDEIIQTVNNGRITERILRELLEALTAHLPCSRVL